jgi:hypothetical protein
MKLEMAQMLENRDKRQTRRDPAEIGSNVDAALLTFDGASAGVVAAGAVDGPCIGVVPPGA